MTGLDDRFVAAIGKGKSRNQIPAWPQLPRYFRPA
ncbi:MAG: hypothetical protein ACI90Z_001405 [Cyanobium sp.]|jgi:hypothetical protein